MIKNPCKDCPNKGRGSFHDECVPYQEFLKCRELDKKDIKQRLDFTRKAFEPNKSSHMFQNKYKTRG